MAAPIAPVWATAVTPALGDGVLAQAATSAVPVVARPEAPPRSEPVELAPRTRAELHGRTPERSQAPARTPDAAQARSRTVHVASAPAVAPETPSEDTRRGHRRPSRTLVRVGVLGSLAAVSVVPVSQALGPGAGALSASGSSSTRSFPSTVSALTANGVEIGAPAALLPPADAVVTRDDTVSRDFDRSTLADCSGQVPDEKTSTNGHVPDRDLCTLWDGHTRVRADAALTLSQLNDAFKARFGEAICLASGYRSYTQQVSVKAEKGGLAAAPGTSNHGWGLAIDLCSQDTEGARGSWIRQNGPVYGWKNPAWALPGGVGPHEPWHWEDAAAVEADGEYSGY